MHAWMYVGGRWDIDVLQLYVLDLQHFERLGLQGVWLKSLLATGDLKVKILLVKLKRHEHTFHFRV